MALVRRRFVAAIIIDAVFLAFVVVSALVHALSDGHRDAEERSATAPFAWHGVHAFIGLVGFAAIVVPAASAPARALTWLAAPAAIADVVAASTQVRAALDEARARTSASDDESSSSSSSTPLTEYNVFALLAAMLALSALNVYWSARAELATFGSTNTTDTRFADVNAHIHVAAARGAGGFGARRR